MLIEKSNDLIGNRTQVTLACSIVSQPTTLPRTPKKRRQKKKRALFWLRNSVCETLTCCRTFVPIVGISVWESILKVGSVLYHCVFVGWCNLSTVFMKSLPHLGRVTFWTRRGLWSYSRPLAYERLRRYILKTEDQGNKFIYREHRNVTLSKIQVSACRFLILHYMSVLREKR
jgi:hypothetical protein